MYNIIIFCFIQNCDLQILCTQINEQLNVDECKYPSGSVIHLYVFYSRNNSRYTHFENLSFCVSYSLVCSEINSFLLSFVSSFDCKFSNFTTFRYTLISGKLVLNNALISSYAGGDTLLGFSL